MEEREIKMVCGNDFCIYNKEGKCSLSGITLDDIGNCEDCIMVTLDEKFLAGEKEKQLLQLNSRNDE